MAYDGTSQLLGSGAATAADIDTWMAANGPRGATYVGLPYQPPPSVGESIRTWASAAKLNSDLVTAQIAHESAFWQSKIVRDKNNPSGLGAENDDPYGKAITFDSPDAGIQASVAHLASYVRGDGPWTAKDPRYQAVKDAGWLGVVHVLSDLDGRWAWPGVGYGASIAAIANDLVAHAQGASGGTVAGDDPRFAWTPDGAEFGYPKPGTHGRSGNPIELLILHITAGTDSQDWLLGGNGSSTHYLTHQNGTPRSQHVAEADAAWTPGSRAYAERSINVEVEMLRVTGWTDAIMHETARTIAPIMARNNIPAVYLGRSNGPGKRGMIGHRDVPNPLPASTPGYCGPWGGSACHSDPGAGFDWTTFVGYVAAELASATPPQPADDGLYLPAPDGKPWPIAYRRGFKGYVQQIGGARYPQDVNAGILSVFGYPKAEEYQASDGNVYQETERAVLIYDPNAHLPWDIVLQTRGQSLPPPKDG